jgi:two-component system LytT family response regulator/two-component system response regulator LytT
MLSCKAVIVDDEAPARDELRFLLASYADMEIVGEGDSGTAALELVTALCPQVIFLDIQMRGLNGFETAKELRMLAPRTLIVFTTAYDEYAVKAFEINAVDYLLKPFDQTRLSQTIGRIRKLTGEGAWQRAAEKVDELLQTKPKVKKLPVMAGGRIILIDFQDIVLARAAGDYVTVFTHQTSYSYAGTLTQLEERLKPGPFLRIHKSHLANLDKISEVIPWFKGTYWLKMSDLEQSQIPVGKVHIKELKDTLGLI